MNTRTEASHKDKVRLSTTFLEQLTHLGAVEVGATCLPSVLRIQQRQKRRKRA